MAHVVESSNSQQFGGSYGFNKVFVNPLAQVELLYAFRQHLANLSKENGYSAGHDTTER